MTSRQKRWSRRIVIFALNVGILFIFLSPLVWECLTSLLSQKSLVSIPPQIEFSELSLEKYIEIFTSKPYLFAMKNSLLVSGVTTALCLIFGSLATYATVRLRFPYKNKFLLFILGTQMIPGMVFLIPFFLFLKRLALLDSCAGLIITYSSFLLPISIWLLRGFFLSIPEELENAARLDGCTRLGALFRIILPLSRPGLVATAVYCFISTWNEFMFALILTSTRARTVPVYIMQFQEHMRSIDFSLNAAAGIVGSIPVIVIVLILQRNIMSGLTAGALRE